MANPHRKVPNQFPEPTQPSLPPTLPPTSRQRNTLNLHRHPLRQLADRHAAPRRLVFKMSLILLIHLREMGHVRQKHIDLDDFRHARPGFGQDGGDVLYALARLLADAAGDGRAVLVEGDLARYVDLVRGFDGLGLCGVRREGLEREKKRRVEVGGGVRRVLLLRWGLVVLFWRGGGRLTRASFLGGYGGEVGHCPWRGGEGSRWQWRTGSGTGMLCDSSGNSVDALTKHEVRGGFGGGVGYVGTLKSLLFCRFMSTLI